MFEAQPTSVVGKAGTPHGTAVTPDSKAVTLVMAMEAYIRNRRRKLVRSDRQDGSKPEFSAGEEVRVRRAVGFFGNGTLVKDVNQDTLDEVAFARWPAGVKAATLGREHVGALKPLLRFATRKGWCQMPELEAIPQWKPLKDWLAPEDVEDLIAASEASDGEIWAVSAIYGYHLSEVIKLTRGDVNLRAGRVTVQVKSPKGEVYVRTTPILPRARGIFERLLAQPGRPGEQLFHRANGKPLGEQDSAETYIGDRLQAAKSATGITQRFTHRSFRSTMATWMLSATNDGWKTVMTFAGWKTYAMVQAYSSTIQARIVPSVLEFYGFPPSTNLVDWLGLPETPSSDGFRGRLRRP